MQLKTRSIVKTTLYSLQARPSNKLYAYLRHHIAAPRYQRILLLSLKQQSAQQLKAWAPAGVQESTTRSVTHILGGSPDKVFLNFKPTRSKQRIFYNHVLMQLEHRTRQARIAVQDKELSVEAYGRTQLQQHIIVSQEKRALYWS